MRKNFRHAEQNSLFFVQCRTARTASGLSGTPFGRKLLKVEQNYLELTECLVPQHAQYDDAAQS
jgi:hypothetical protein